MSVKLTAHQARIIGCLLEKESTTPEQYPLSLNSLTNACNQKSNREPVLSLDESLVQISVDELIKQHLVVEKTGFGSRISKYQHRFCNTELGTMRLSDQERAIICVMLLRGPQTPGELRSRTSRLAAFTDVQQIEATLLTLTQREGGPLVIKLARVPGKREVRYAHLFSIDAPTDVATSEEQDVVGLVVNSEQTTLALRVEALEDQVRQMQSDIKILLDSRVLDE